MLQFIFIPRRTALSFILSLDGHLSPRVVRRGIKKIVTSPCEESCPSRDTTIVTNTCEEHCPSRDTQSEQAQEKRVVRRGIQQS